MKNRGFGLSNMFFFMAIFIVLLIVVSLIVHNIHLDDRNNPLMRPEGEEIVDKDFDYGAIEKNLKTAATLYQRDYYPDFDDKEAMYVTSKKLISLDYLNVLTDGEVSCVGYARIFYDNVVEVTPFIKCGSYYETKGYEAVRAD